MLEMYISLAIIVAMFLATGIVCLVMHLQERRYWQERSISDAIWALEMRERNARTHAWQRAIANGWSVVEGSPEGTCRTV